MAAWLDNVRFNPTAGGTTDWVVSTAVTGYQTPALGGAVNGRVYKVFAISADGSQWEISEGAYTSGTTTFARTTVLYNSSGTGTATGQSGAGSKINFTNPPTVAVVAAKEDLISIEEANSFTTAQKTQARSNIAAGIRGYIAALTLSTAGASATFSVAAGECADSTAVDLLVLGSAYSKTTSAWAVGSTNGALDTGAIAANTWYHVFLIKRVDTGVVDVLISLSATAPTMPTNYTLKRRIGAMKTNGSSQWIKFIQLGDEFLWDVPVNDASAASPGTTGTNYTLTVPTGIQVNAIGSAAWFFVTAGNYLKLSSLDTTGAAASSTNFSLYSSSGTTPGSTGFSIRTNTSGQIRARSDGSGGSMYIITDGWFDSRGRYD